MSAPGIERALEQLQTNGARRFTLRIGNRQALRARYALRNIVPRDPVAAGVVRILEALQDGPCIVTVERIVDG